MDKLSGARARISSGLANRSFMQFLSVIVSSASILLIIACVLNILIGDSDSLGGIVHLVIHVYGIIFAFLAFATELSLSVGQSQYAQRVLQNLPFIRAKFGRPLFYMTSSLILFVFCSENNQLAYFSSVAIFLCGLIYGLISMQPGNELDTRGFQRPNQNDFLSRIQTRGSQSFDNMAASYISLASSRYLENTLSSESQALQDRVLREVEEEKCPG
jgi:hypothetical protein